MCDFTGAHDERNVRLCLCVYVCVCRRTCMDEQMRMHLLQPLPGQHYRVKSFVTILVVCR